MLLAPLSLYLTPGSVDTTDASQFSEAKTPAGLLVALQRLQRSKRRVFGPRLFVVKSSHALWRAVVLDLADETDVVLIDVSEASENLIWEIQTLHASQRYRCVFIGQVDQIEQRSAGQPDDKTNATLRELLQGQHIIAYNPGAGGRKPFARALRAALSTTVAKRRETPGAVDRTVRHRLEEQLNGVILSWPKQADRLVEFSYDHFTPAAQRAWLRAYMIADARGESQITAEDLWLGILDAGDPVGRELLRCLGLSPDEIGEIAQQNITRGDWTEAKAAVALSWYEALRNEHWFISTEHFILGLLHEGGRIPTALAQRGVSYGAARWWAAAIWRVHRLPAGSFNATRAQQVATMGCW